MKRSALFNRYLTIGIALTVSVTVQGRNLPTVKSKQSAAVTAKAANCSPATAFATFEFNNVRTGAETGGDTWYDRGNSLPFYEVPAGSDNHVIFAGALWMGGVDPAGNLKLAAILYRQDGNDYWPGPLTVDGTASIEPATCELWDNFFYMSRQQAEIHRYYFLLLNQGLDPSQDPLFVDGYTIPQEILSWPAMGNQALGQSAVIAPFADLRDPETGDVLTTPGVYEPNQGDYPLYDLDSEIDCRTRLVTDPVPLFGDNTMFWVFNDRGNVHTESQGEPIGMEIQAQMFSFSTNDEINNMTFCNYVLINRGSLTLQDTYFAQYADTDVGNAEDDYIGCDVMRGLGYSYNGDAFDDGSQSGPGYGAQPPAVGIDFFEGPYQDADGINNDYGIGPNEALNGLGYRNPADSILPFGVDSIIDNERFGMRRFIYFNRGDFGVPATQDPQIAIQFYNQMRGIWNNGVPMTFGGTGYIPPNLPPGLQADFMFPGTTDPLHWGTDGVDPSYVPPNGSSGGWTEANEGNPVGDRRFLQSAGPFTLEPGEFNNITVGVVFAQSQTGNPFQSVVELTQADDKAQALFENCFRLLSGPDAPALSVQELDREIILYLRNTSATSNNLDENYMEIDPTIPPFSLDSVDGELAPNDRFYRFQGYQVYQLRDEDVSIADIEDPELARLVYQGDIRDFREDGSAIGQLINYENDAAIGLPVPREKVNGANSGVVHSIQITEDAFASGATRLVNFKKYYYIAVAYAYNQYEPFNPDPNELTGQATPFLRGRSSGVGGEITSITAIPHKPVPEQFGTVVNAQYGDGIAVTRVEGRGNAQNITELDSLSRAEMLQGPLYKKDEVSYLPGAGPIGVKVIDPLNVVPARFELKFYGDEGPDGGYDGDIDNARWFMVDLNNPQDTIFSERSITVFNEQLVPEYGIAIEIGQAEYLEVNPDDPQDNKYPLLNGATLTFQAGTPEWLSGVADTEGQSFSNWIRSGLQAEETPDPDLDCFLQADGTLQPQFFDDQLGIDDQQVNEGVLDGTFAPARLAAAYNCNGIAPMTTVSRAAIVSFNRDLTPLGSVELVITPDKSLWSRVPVFELQGDPALAQANKPKLTLRGYLSVDKNGLTQLDPGANIDECTFFGQQVFTQEMVDDLDTDEAEALVEAVAVRYPQIADIQQLVGLSFGMGWFPGYVISPTTGERLNLAFGENSYLAADNGRDMLWNPSARQFAGLNGQPVYGGEHYIYTFRNQALADQDDEYMGPYDNGQYAYEKMNGGTGDRFDVYSGLEWIAFPLLSETASYRPVSEGLVPGAVNMSVSVAEKYQPYATTAEELGEQSLPYTPVDENLDLSENFWYPMYRFSTEDVATATGVIPVAKNALDLIDIVPNPYYAYSSYETSRIDNRVKFINLPPECTIKIFTINGTLIRVFEKDSPETFLEWNLQNENFVPIAGGIYLIHVQSDPLGERVLKFFAATKPADLRNF